MADARVPIIALSGRSRAADAAEATAAGMDGYLVKPVSPRVLAETLTAASARVAPPPGSPDSGDR